MRTRRLDKWLKLFLLVWAFSFLPSFLPSCWALGETDATLDAGIFFATKNALSSQPSYIGSNVDIQGKCKAVWQAPVLWRNPKTCFANRTGSCAFSSWSLPGFIVHFDVNCNGYIEISSDQLLYISEGSCAQRTIYDRVCVYRQ
ncbi:hypothetical protein [Thermosulfurimonas sp. F29]|uniref:hypothetical protein n=1 Tax=Thermosulfurimonas sp. F29 TaxID=2867247 RepID=UPI001C838FFC|nr:hypothetical protein [Thermosulfurimonas sp. F29]MBX6424179.1 hypothetical protein [Thermosulfurimonas sp. F29]